MLLEIVRRRHGALVDLILPVIEEAQRQQHLIQRRGQVTSNETSLFSSLTIERARQS
jgi:hypothetical protein